MFRNNSGLSTQITNSSRLNGMNLKQQHQNKIPYDIQRRNNQAVLRLFGQPTQSQLGLLSQQQPIIFGDQSIYQQLSTPQKKQQIKGDDDPIDQNGLVGNYNQQTYDLENNLTFEIRSLFKLGKLLDSRPQYLPGMISLKTKEVSQQASKQSRVGVDLICLIDKSGSMQGEKIQMVQQTLNILLDFLTERDRLQLIIFDDEAQRLTPLKKINDVNKQQMKNVISRISANGGTTISTAFEIAFEQLKSRKQRNVTSIFILSDGQDQLAESDVRKQMADVKEVLTIHSFGFGADHDAEMMTALCNLGKGSFYFVKNIKLLDEFFADALGALISVVGTEILIDVSCKPAAPYQDVHLAKVYGKAWITLQDKRQFKIFLPQISSGSRKDFVFEIELPKFNLKINDQFRSSILIEARIKVKNPNNGKVISKYDKLVVTFFNQDEQIHNNEQDVDVAVQYYRVKAIETIQYARKKCDENQNEEAQKIIENLIVAIKKNQKVASLSAGIIQDLQQAKQGSSKFSYGSYGQQQMYQLISNHDNQSGTNAVFSSNGVQMSQKSPQMYQNMYSYNMMQLVQSKKP